MASRCWLKRRGLSAAVAGGSRAEDKEGAVAQTWLKDLVGNESCQRACVSLRRVVHLSNAEQRIVVLLMQLTSNHFHSERRLGVDNAAQGRHGFVH
jgi:hypothetical protein